MGCTQAPSCRAALEQANLLWPNRDKASDGICGDAAHQQTHSDHNTGDAVDVTAVIGGTWSTPDGQVLVDMLVARRDSRVAYLIWNHRMWRAYDKPGIPAWTPDSYTGASPHTEHVHISLWTDGKNAQARADTSPWWGQAPVTKGTNMIVLVGPDNRCYFSNPEVKRYIGAGADLDALKASGIPVAHVSQALLDEIPDA